jgi:hypothetical protein
LGTENTPETVCPSNVVYVICSTFPCGVSGARVLIASSAAARSYSKTDASAARVVTVDRGVPDRCDPPEPVHAPAASASAAIGATARVNVSLVMLLLSSPSDRSVRLSS